jgi:hypothetical protein
MDWRKYFTGEYIAAIEFGDKQPTLTISGVKPVKVEEEGKPTKSKAVITFKERDRPWLLNKTNAMCLAGMFGPDTDQWIGKRVTLLAVMVQVGKGREPGIRIKGSPDLKGPVRVEIKLPRKRPVTMIMAVTGQRPNGQPRAAEPMPPDPSPDDSPPPEPSEPETDGADINF